MKSRIIALTAMACLASGSALATQDEVLGPFKLEQQALAAPDVCAVQLPSPVPLQIETFSDETGKVKIYRCQFTNVGNDIPATTRFVLTLKCPPATRLVKSGFAVGLNAETAGIYLRGHLELSQSETDLVEDLVKVTAALSPEQFQWHTVGYCEDNPAKK